ncbi:Avt2p [Sugiyamaella lignohabitans]|uniref:Avt2p n=1 Tax=Sugiyamaella lignohabitans TaxID=796027 RepID=A0A161HG67_9ASCO|nr:Avt2p [Sugiyamaella lignohabitans]ANB11701.1 Avt2p [Sugiyamaella lignohabitans]
MYKPVDTSGLDGSNEGGRSLLGQIRSAVGIGSSTESNISNGNGLRNPFAEGEENPFILDEEEEGENEPTGRQSNDQDVPKHSRHGSSLSNTHSQSFDINDEDALLDDYENEGNDNTGSLGHNEFLLSLANQTDKSNLKMAFMNMANSIIGAGIIGQPYAVRQAGLLAGIFLLLSLTVVIDWTIRLMVTNAKMSGTDTFQATVKHCFGKPGLIAISLAQCLFAFGGSMAFCVIIGDTIPHVISALFPSLKTIPVISTLTSRNGIIILFTMCISTPLALNRNISHLAKASGLALISMLIIVLTVLIRGPQIGGGPDAHFTPATLTINWGIFQAVSVISFAFVCHHNSLIIYDSLKTPTMDRFARVTHWSTGVSMVACMAMGLAGFLVFKDNTKGNVLNNFPPNDTMANVARFCFGLNMLTTLPLEIFVCREVIWIYFFPDGPIATTKQHAILTLTLIVSAMTVSLFTCNLGAILELVGASSACTMAYILPPMCYLKLSRKRLIHKLSSYACIGFGVVVMILSSAQTIAKLFNDSEENHCTV